MMGLRIELEGINLKVLVKVIEVMMKGRKKRAVNIRKSFDFSFICSCLSEF